MNITTRFPALEGTKQETIRFRKWEFFDQQLEIILPDVLEPMTEEHIRCYYPKKEHPAVLLADETGTLLYPRQQALEWYGAKEEVFNSINCSKVWGNPYK